MRYLLSTNTSCEYLAKQFERAVLTHYTREGSKIAVCVRSFFLRLRFLASENGFYELANIFCHVGLGTLSTSVANE